MSSPTEPSRGDDPFAPPKEPIEVFCLHCGEEYESWQIKWVPRPNIHGDVEGGMTGDWCCPTEGCNGVGFGFDIVPCDQEWRSEDGLSGWCDDGYEEQDYEGVVDNAVMEQRWECKDELSSPDRPDELRIDSEGLEEHPLKRMLPPEELPDELKMNEDDIPF